MCELERKIKLGRIATGDTCAKVLMNRVMIIAQLATALYREQALLSLKSRS